jgi:hypothetical protein
MRNEIFHKVALHKSVLCSHYLAAAVSNKLYREEKSPFDCALRSLNALFIIGESPQNQLQ